MGRHALRNMRRLHVAVGATAIALPPSAAALADAATTEPTKGSEIRIKLAEQKIDYGRDISVLGQTSSSEAGQTVSLEFAPAQSGGISSWARVASTAVGSDGRFRLRAPLRRSGAVRAIGAWQTQGQSTTTTTTTTQVPTAGAAQDSSVPTTDPEHVVVAARLSVASRELDVVGPRDPTVRGHLLPAASGRRVRLQALDGGRWQTVGTARTEEGGFFAVRFTPHGSGRERLRVLFGGDRINAATHREAGSVVVFTQSVASWYNDGGTTGCGFHAYYGVANVSLPCGTKVTFSYGGHTVNAVVDDRGPYAGGRRWDLNQNTAAALGFGGVGTVWSSQ